MAPVFSSLPSVRGSKLCHRDNVYVSVDRNRQRRALYIVKPASGGEWAWYGHAEYGVAFVVIK